MKYPLATSLAFAALTATSFSQGGPLTPPPGVPAPTMKSLDLVEPRITLVEGAPGVSIGALGTITISQPGSYYLTGNLQITGNGSGVSINASGVSLDLMGHSIIAPPSGNALNAVAVVPARSNIRIQNGRVLSTSAFSGSSFTLSGFSSGILTDSTNQNISVSNLTVRGVRETGIRLSGTGSIVENCSVFISGLSGIQNTEGNVFNSMVNTAGATGIRASVVSSCIVNNALETGIIASTVLNSSAQSISTSASGISATTVDNSIGISSGQHGISASAVSNSYGQSTNVANDRNGIDASAGQVSGSKGESAGGHGIRAISVSSSIGSSSGANGVLSSGISADRVSHSRGSGTSASGGRGISGAYSVTGSYGSSIAVQGIYSANGNVTDSYGSSSGNGTSARGIEAWVITSSRGSATGASGGAGIYAIVSASNSVGSSVANSGIFAHRYAIGCYGTTTHTATTSHGINSSGTVSNSYALNTGNGSGDGINAIMVIASYGYAATGARHGISSTIVESSVGQRQSIVAGKSGISANRASLSQSINGEAITNKYNMP